MARSILSASLVRPVWQWATHRVEGPDEDTFTLGLGALQQLGRQIQPKGARGLERVHLVGSFPPETEWTYGEALGVSNLEVRRHPATAPGLWAALAAAAHDEGSSGREAVVAADLASISTESTGLPRVRQGAGGAAFLMGQEPGLAVLRHGFRGHAPGRAPPIKELVASWLQALDLPQVGGAGEAVFSTDGDPARWQAAWEETVPGLNVTLVEPPSESEGAAPVLPAANLLWELGRRLRTGTAGVVGESLRGRSGFAGFRLDGPIRWLGAWGTLEPGMKPPSAKFLERAHGMNAVSQGAYVPHPRYLENLPSRWRLVGERCSHCRALTFPASGRCRSCGRSDGLRAEAQPRESLRVESVTTIGAGAQPTEFDPLVEAAGAYDVAIVALESGARATVQVTDAVPGQLRVGDRVGLVLRRLYPMEGEWRYGLKAVPERTDSAGSPSAPRVNSTTTRTASSGVPTAPRSIPRRRGGPSESRPRRVR